MTGLLFLFSVVLVIGSYEIGLETLYLAKQEGMINGDFVFILFELNQATVDRKSKYPFLWFFNYHIGPEHRFVTNFKFYKMYLLANSGKGTRLVIQRVRVQVTL